MSFNPDFIQQFQGLSESDPFPVKLEEVSNILGFEGKYTALEVVQSYFEEYEDYTLHANTCYLSVACLQELAMIAPTPEGKAARLYFLECERRAKTVTGDRSCEQSPPKAVPLVVPTDAELHAMRTREQEKMELAALPVWDKNIPVYRRATDVVHDFALRTKEESENIDW